MKIAKRAALRQDVIAEEAIGEKTARELIIESRRFDADLNLIYVPAETVSLLQEVFAGTTFIANKSVMAEFLQHRSAVLEHWQKSKIAFINVGRALIAVDKLLGSERAAAERLKKHSERLFPFSAPVASMLRACAQMVDKGVVSEAELPASYTTAYQISLLSDVELAIARERGLISEKTQRPAILRFRRTIKYELAAPHTLGRIDLRKQAEGQLARLSRLEALERRKEAVEAELAGILAEIEQLGSKTGDGLSSHDAQDGSTDRDRDRGDGLASISEFHALSKGGDEGQGA